MAPLGTALRLSAIALLLAVSTTVWAQGITEDTHNQIAGLGMNLTLTTTKPNDLILIAGNGWPDLTAAPTCTVNGSAATLVAYTPNSADNNGGACVFYFQAGPAGAYNIAITSNFGTIYSIYTFVFAVGLQGASATGITGAAGTTLSGTSASASVTTSTANAFIFCTSTHNTYLNGPPGGVIAFTSSPTNPTLYTELSEPFGLDAGWGHLTAGAAGTYSVTATDPATYPGYGCGEVVVAVPVADTAPPTVPNPLTPANGSTVNTPTPTLTWSASTDDTFVSNYDVQVASDSAFSAIEWSGTVTGTSTLTGALPNGTHFWHVRARDSAGLLSAWSTTFSFTTSAGAQVWGTPTPGSASGGGISNTRPNSVDPVLAINPATNLPGVAWTAPNASNGEPAIYFRELSGGSWVEDAGSGSGAGVSNVKTSSQFPSLAYDASGAPVIAWEGPGTTGAPSIFLRRYTGGAWSELSGSGSGGGLGQGDAPSVAVNPATGQPGVAWSQASGGVFNIVFLEYNGTQWVSFPRVGASTVSGSITGAAEPNLTYDQTGKPTIAWSDASQIYVRRFSAGDWRELAGSASGGGISNGQGSNHHPSVQTDNAGDLFVVWENTPANGVPQVYGRAFNGQWTDFGPGSATGGGISWTTGGARTPVLAKSPSTDKTFLVTWSDSSDPDGLPEVYAKWYSGGMWMQVGGPSASHDGVSNSSVVTSHPWCGIAKGAVPTAYACWGGGAGSNGQIYVKSLTMIVTVDAPKEVVVGGGTGGRGQYRVFSNGTGATPYAPLSLRTLGWAAYNTANGTLHPACGDVEGNGVDDVVVGLGRYPAAGGYVCVVHENTAQTTVVAWLHLPWSQYDAANGETFPACGDLHGTGHADIVVGQGAYPGGAGGYCAVFGGAPSFPFLGWIHGGSAPYDLSNGAVHPACGDVDGDGVDEVVLGFGTGAGGQVQVLDDAAHGYASMGTLYYANAVYNTNNGATWPTVVGRTAQTGAEIIVGPGRGGNGVACVYGGAARGFGRIGALNLPWGTYDTQVGELRPAGGTTEATGNVQVVAGLGSFPTAGGWLYVFENVTTSSPNGRWIQYTNGNPSYNSTNGETFPAVGQLR